MPPSLVRSSSIPALVSHSEQCGTARTAPLTGASRIHPAIASFVGSFVLIRYKLINAKDHAAHMHIPLTADVKDMLASQVDAAHTPASPPNLDRSKSQGSEHLSNMTTPFTATHMLSMLSMWQNWSDVLSDVHGRVFISQVQLLGCFRPAPRNGIHVDPPIRLLSNCHTLSVTMAVIGFLLALIGILAFVWTSLPDAVAAFTTACLTSCLLAIITTFALA